VKRFLVIAVAIGCLLIGRPMANAQDAGVNGKWHFVLSTPGGDREVEAEFAVDVDSKVTGKFGSTDVAGTYKDGQLDLDFQFTSDEAGVTAAMKMSGKLDETSAFNGNWDFSSYNGTFKATRPPVPSAPPAPAAAPDPSTPSAPSVPSAPPPVSNPPAPPAPS
jgi:hypothetical protein